MKRSLDDRDHAAEPNRKRPSPQDEPSFSSEFGSDLMHLLVDFLKSEDVRCLREAERSYSCSTLLQKHAYKDQLVSYVKQLSGGPLARSTRRWAVQPSQDRSIYVVVDRPIDILLVSFKKTTNSTVVVRCTDGGSLNKLIVLVNSELRIQTYAQGSVWSHSCNTLQLQQDLRCHAFYCTGQLTPTVSIEDGNALTCLQTFGCHACLLKIKCNLQLMVERLFLPSCRLQFERPPSMPSDPLFSTPRLMYLQTEMLANHSFLSDPSNLQGVSIYSGPFANTLRPSFYGTHFHLARLDTLAAWKTLSLSTLQTLSIQVSQLGTFHVPDNLQFLSVKMGAFADRHTQICLSPNSQMERLCLELPGWNGVLIQGAGTALCLEEMNASNTGNEVCTLLEQWPPRLECLAVRKVELPQAPCPTLRKLDAVHSGKDLSKSFPNLQMWLNDFAILPECMDLPTSLDTLIYFSQCGKSAILPSHVRRVWLNSESDVQANHLLDELVLHKKSAGLLKSRFTKKLTNFKPYFENHFGSPMFADSWRSNALFCMQPFDAIEKTFQLK